jgi:LAO/AO transport system kinase
LFPFTGNALTIGVTGAPGAGKSTLVNHFIRALRTEGKRIGVIAVDPTSPFSGGAILGDRIRMNEHYADPGVFIRSLATRGRLGGLSVATGDLSLLLDAAGYDVVLIETVGVGQDEVDVARLADVTAVVLVPGMGDDVQTMKAGIMEIADVFLLNKADQPGIDKLQRELETSLPLTEPDRWMPPIVRCVASEGTGISEAVAAIRSSAESVQRPQAASANWAERLREMFRERAVARLDGAAVEAAAVEVAARRIDPFTVVERWLKGCE